MQILGLKKYSHGYCGCFSTRVHYVFFLYARGRFKAYLRCRKCEFQGDDHFISVMAKFIQTSFFSRTPVSVKVIDHRMLAHSGDLQHTQGASQRDMALRLPRPPFEISDRIHAPAVDV